MLSLLIAVSLACDVDSSAVSGPSVVLDGVAWSARDVPALAAELDRRGCAESSLHLVEWRRHRAAATTWGIVGALVVWPALIVSGVHASAAARERRELAYSLTR